MINVWPSIIFARPKENSKTHWRFNSMKQMQGVYDRIWILSWAINGNWIRSLALTLDDLNVFYDLFEQVNMFHRGMSPHPLLAPYYTFSGRSNTCFHEGRLRKTATDGVPGFVHQPASLHWNPQLSFQQSSVPICIIVTSIIPQAKFITLIWTVTMGFERLLIVHNLFHNLHPLPFVYRKNRFIGRYISCTTFSTGSSWQ